MVTLEFDIMTYITYNHENIQYIIWHITSVCSLAVWIVTSAHNGNGKVGIAHTIRSNQRRLK